MSSGDRRPWLILSRREAIAVREALAEAPRQGPPDLQRALRIIEAQLAWIEGGSDRLEDQDRPSIAHALQRERFGYAD